MPGLPLSGLTIVDFSTLLPGPLASLILSEAGAEVIKIEPPGGEGMRRSLPKWGPHSAIFSLLNASKKCIALDLKNIKHRDALVPLIQRADILIEQFRPGVMQRLGLDYVTLEKHNSKLIYCSITGYGQTGEFAQRAGHDLNYLAETGLLALNPGPAENPQFPPLLAADIAGGAYPAVINILLALAARQRTGKGAHLDVAMTDNLFPFAFWALPNGWLKNAWPQRGTHAFSGGSPRYQLYTTSDGALLAVGALEDKFWHAFCDAIALGAEHRDAASDADAAIRAVRKIIASQPAAHWQQVFAETDCCCSLVKTLAEAVNTPHFRGRGLFDYMLEDDGEQPLTALPLPLVPELRRPKAERRGPAAVGQHNDEFLGETSAIAGEGKD